MKNVVLIFAGGVGSRMGSDIPKQFLEVGNKPIIIQTLELFEANERIDSVYVGCIKEYIPLLEEMIKRFNVSKIKRIYPGGSSGQDTIYKGLKTIREDYEKANVLIHDGVRPLVSEDTIDKVIDDVESYGTSIVVTPAFETPIVSYDGKNVSAMPERRIVYTAQAPQAFRLNDILNWHELERLNENPYNGIVDSCGLAFKNGINCHLTEGNRGNIKVTTDEDYLSLIANNTVDDISKLLEIRTKKKSKKKEL